MSVDAFTSREEKWVGEKSEEYIIEENGRREREHGFSLKVTGIRVCCTQVARCSLNVMNKWSEIGRDSTKMFSAIQLHV